MSRFEKLSHVLWHCQYHIVWVPKYRFRILKGQVAREVFNCIQIYCGRLGCQVVELNVQEDHVHRGNQRQALASTHKGLVVPTTKKGSITSRFEKNIVWAHCIQIYCGRLCQVVEDVQEDHVHLGKGTAEMLNIGLAWSSKRQNSNKDIQTVCHIYGKSHIGVIIFGLKDIVLIQWA